MTARTQTKQYGHFLVKWDGNGKETEYLVVQRSKILDEGRIKFGETYNTICGDSSATDADDVQVIATGEWLEMRKLLKVHQDAQTSPDKSSEVSLPDSPQPSKRRRLISKDYSYCYKTRSKSNQLGRWYYRLRCY